MYNVKSTKAEEFISHEEVLSTLEYAEKNKNNVELIDNILNKARKLKGLSHREAAVLLECEIEEKNNMTNNFIHGINFIQNEKSTSQDNEIET